MACLPIFMYHHVSPHKGDMVTVTPKVFEEHLRYIKKGGYTTVGLDTVVEFMEGRSSLDGKCVALTFDDGYLDNYLYAWPLLKAYGMKASVFVVTGWVDGASRAGDGERPAAAPTHDECKRLVAEGDFARVSMDWEMMREMNSTGLVEFHSHTVTHRSCDRIPEDELAGELKRSKEAVEENLGTECKYLCWPKGRFNDSSLRAAKEAGYRAVFTTRHGVARAGDDPYSINRVVVKDRARWFSTRLRIYTSGPLTDFYLKVKGGNR